MTTLAVHSVSVHNTLPTLPLPPDGLLIVHDVNMLNLDALLATLQPETALITTDRRERQLVYLRKPS